MHIHAGMCMNALSVARFVWTRANAWRGGPISAALFLLFLCRW